MNKGSNRFGFWLSYGRAAAIWLGVFSVVNLLSYFVVGLWVPWYFLILLALVWPMLMTAIT